MLTSRVLSAGMKSAVWSQTAVRGMSEAASAVKTAAAATSSVSKDSVGPNPRRHTETRAKLAGAANIHQAVDFLKSSAWAKFDETVEISLNTGLDPRKPNQSVKGVAKLPAGTGKKIRVCVIAGAGDVKAALEAGADLAGAEEVIAALQGGDLNYNTIIATPEMMPMVGKIGRVSHRHYQFV